ncbi:class I SAM-dependent methyltransferase [Bradyrhizobium diversitatis]|uniref:Class I SAM-dependent methyltransferase n=1 Tax=Bradyrhizobium diversitatis TaxID=2755406 RepID=A0ABS0PG69_9BRAD|nr:class I SAM-dependent methyltransferase [Bradyrhizobium diversitatis]MBH5392094.1 class I SAM-dependent methyltransferase [Bradyrhizobium diversitatis]
MMRPLRIYLSGSIKKGAGDSRTPDHFWTREDEEFIRANAGRPVELLNPSKADIRRQDFAINFGCDLHLVSISDVVLVDARREKGIGVGAEMMFAIQRGIPVITWSPPDTHYRRSKITDLFGEDLHDWTHPFVFGLSDHVVDDLQEAMTIIQSGALNALAPRREQVEALIQRYRAVIGHTGEKTAKRFVEIGGGVFQDLLGGGSEQEVIAGATRYRFMDVLYLPTPTDEIPPDAVLTVNRWRERRIEERPLLHSSRIRRVAAAAIQAMQDGARVLEIGCGKFPLADDVACKSWSGLEIDPEAVDYLRGRGLRVAASAAEVRPEDLQIDILVALFSMQFAIQEEELALLEQLPSKAIVMFNLPTRDRSLVDRRLWQLGSLGLRSRLLDLQATGNRDVIVAAGGQNDQAGLSLVSKAILERARVEWPSAALLLEWSEPK